MIDTEIRRQPLSIDDLREDWDALFRHSGREPAMSFEWSRGVVRSHLAGGDDCFLVVLRRAGRVVGLVPMMIKSERQLGRPVSVLQPMEDKYNTHSDLLLARDDADLVGAWLDAIASPRAGTWDVLQIPRLIEHGPLVGALSNELARRRASHRWRLEHPSFHLPLPDSYQAYLATRSGKLRNYLKRADKKLAAEGEVTFTCVQRGDPADQAYDELLAIERQSWKHDRGTAISVTPQQEAFYRDLIETALHAGTLHLTFLRLAGVPIAYNLGLVSGGTYLYVKTSYNQTYRAHGAASVGRARLIEQLIAEGHTALDFPGEPYEWERQWTDSVRWHLSLLLFNTTLTGRAIGLAAKARDFIRPQRQDRRIVFSPAPGLGGGPPAS